jgi:hypothetical protein
MIFFIYIPGRKEFTGGHVVLHKLTKIISDLGYEVWSNQIPLFDCNCKLVEDIDATKEYIEKIVVVYAEQIIGNPLNAKNVCRWILYHTKEDVENTWSETDIRFKFVPGFKTITSSDKVLTVLDSKLEIFRNEGLGDKRTGFCHINKKKYPIGEKLLESLNSIDLSDFDKKGGFSYLASEFNKYEYFVTYDDATYYSILAALCGCRSVILNPDLTITPEEYRKKFPVRKYGVAYGWQDMKHADLTRDLVREHIKNYEKESIKSVNKFINFWIDKINNN